jgi:hypothetical protein
VRGLRALRPAEATAVWHLIARSRPAASQVDGIPSLPRRTFQTVRQRVYERGWITDRFIPSPSVFGTGRIVFALSQPLSDRAAGLVDRWRARPGNVLLWASDESIFGVFLEPENDASSVVAGLAIEQSSRDHCVVRVACHRETIPAYFDYEAGWVRATGLPGVIGYPRSLQRESSISIKNSAHRPTSTQRQAMADLASTAPFQPGQPTSESFGSRLTRRSAEERYIRRGWATFRSFLNPIEVARSVTGFPGWCAFVWGTLQPGAGTREFFQALVAEAVVSPFLFATDKSKVLFATLSEGPGNRRNVERVPVLSVVRRYLQDIAVVRWPLVSTRVIVDHAYELGLHSRAAGQLGGGP